MGGVENAEHPVHGSRADMTTKPGYLTAMSLRLYSAEK